MTTYADDARIVAYVGPCRMSEAFYRPTSYGVMCAACWTARKPADGHRWNPMVAEDFAGRTIRCTDCGEAL